MAEKSLDRKADSKLTELDHAIECTEARPAVYVLMQITGGPLYKGSCRDLVERLKDHRAGRVSRTKNQRPLALVHHEYFGTFTEARQKENFLKSGQGREWLKQHLARVAKWQTQGTFRLGRIR
ncbi:MAG: GIY-YIG nuclease family protein, partial [bacterium]